MGAVSTPTDASTLPAPPAYPYRQIQQSLTQFEVARVLEQHVRKARQLGRSQSHATLSASQDPDTSPSSIDAAAPEDSSPIATLPSNSLAAQPPTLPSASSMPTISTSGISPSFIKASMVHSVQFQMRESNASRYLGVSEDVLAEADYDFARSSDEEQDAMLDDLDDDDLDDLDDEAEDETRHKLLSLTRSTDVNHHEHRYKRLSKPQLVPSSIPILRSVATTTTTTTPPSSIATVPVVSLPDPSRLASRGSPSLRQALDHDHEEEDDDELMDTNIAPPTSEQDDLLASCLYRMFTSNTAGISFPEYARVLSMIARGYVTQPSRTLFQYADVSLTTERLISSLSWHSERWIPTTTKYSNAKKRWRVRVRSRVASSRCFVRCKLTRPPAPRATS